MDYSYVVYTPRPGCSDGSPLSYRGTLNTGPPTFHAVIGTATSTGCATHYRGSPGCPPTYRDALNTVTPRVPTSPPRQHAPTPRDDLITNPENDTVYDDVSPSVLASLPSPSCREELLIAEAQLEKKVLRKKVNCAVSESKKKKTATPPVPKIFPKTV